MRVPSSRLRLLAAALQPLCLALVFAVSLPLAAFADDSHAVIHTKKGDFTFNIEVVDTEAGREKGLMFRKSLAPDDNGAAEWSSAKTATAAIGAP